MEKRLRPPLQSVLERAIGPISGTLLSNARHLKNLLQLLRPPQTIKSGANSERDLGIVRTLCRLLSMGFPETRKAAIAGVGISPLPLRI